LPLFYQPKKSNIQVIKIFSFYGNQFFIQKGGNELKRFKRINTAMIFLEIL